MTLKSPTIGEWNALAEKGWRETLSMSSDNENVQKMDRAALSRTIALFWATPKVDGNAQVPYLFGSEGTKRLNNMAYRSYVLDLEEELAAVHAAKYAANWIGQFIFWNTSEAQVS